MAVMLSANLFANLPVDLPIELTETLWQTTELRVERIVSRGHCTPPDQWYDQDSDEWVLLLTGGAGLRLEGREEPLTLGPGDHVLLPAHLRHRVEWTDAAVDTIWLAVHARRT